MAAAAAASRSADAPCTGSSSVTSLQMELRDTSSHPSLVISWMEGAFVSPTLARNLVTPWGGRWGSRGCVAWSRMHAYRTVNNAFAPCLLPHLGQQNHHPCVQP